MTTEERNLQKIKTEGPNNILKSMIWSALTITDRNKATELDGIAIEKFASLYGIDLWSMIEIVTEIYDSGEISENFNRCIYIAMTKKLCANEWELYWIISQKKLVNLLLGF